MCLLIMHAYGKRLVHVLFYQIIMSLQIVNVFLTLTFTPLSYNGSKYLFGNKVRLLFLVFMMTVVFHCCHLHFETHFAILCVYTAVMTTE